MHIHILGICGTFMGGIATIARDLGHKVTGSDQNVYPPMSTMLEEQGVEIIEGFDESQLNPSPDIVIIGNAMSRGNPAVEYVLNNNIAYTSGPQWLSENVLRDRWVLGVAGTHGKTTTTSMLTWILQANGIKPGFLIGGVAKNFGVSASLGDSDFFVIEADEYDTAFFDKRSKFVHYHCRTAILNNLEFDHADIFENIEAIQTQFHHLIRTVPGNGLVIYPKDETYLEQVIQQGCWTPTSTLSEKASDQEKSGHKKSDQEKSGQEKSGQEKSGQEISKQNNTQWQCKCVKSDYSQFDILHNGDIVGTVNWDLIGRHNMFNGLAAIVAARHIGIAPQHAIESLLQFEGIKRRMEIRGVVNGIIVYDDFAHHPTAIKTTLDGLRRQVGSARIIAILEPRSNTMKQGVHAAALADSLKKADLVYALQPGNIDWDLSAVLNVLQECHVETSVESIIDKASSILKQGDHVLIMSNGDFAGIHQKLLTVLDSK